VKPVTFDGWSTLVADTPEAADGVVRHLADLPALLARLRP
jgi:hypothetical protein